MLPSMATLTSSLSYLDKRSGNPADTSKLAAERAYRMFNAPLELLDDEDALIAIAYRTQISCLSPLETSWRIIHPHHRNPVRMVCEPSGWTTVVQPYLR